MGFVEETRATIAGGDTRVLRCDGAGPTLVLVHGFSDSADTWRPLLERLAASGRAALAFDLPGFGAADPMPTGDVLPRFEAAVVDVCDRLVVEGAPPVIVGNSLGALVVMWTANRGRARIGGMVSVCPGGLCHPLWLPILATPVARSLVSGIASTPAREPVLSFVLQHILATTRTPEVADHRRRYLAHLTHARVAHQLSIFRRFLDEDDFPIDLSKISCPAMFVFGARDRLLVREGNRVRVQRIARRIDQAVLHTIPGVGHLAQLEAPGQLHRLLTEFSPASDPTSRGRRRPDYSPSTA